jgi:DNA repair photolyase
LTRGCLEVCAEFGNPVGIITKAPLVERDIDVLQAIARVASVHVVVSVPFWDPEKARLVEPYVATPARRMRVIQRMAEAGISVGVNVAPIIPGLNDEEIPQVLAAAKDAGATSAGCVLLRLPGPVAQVFEERMRAVMPLRAERILHRVRETRGGALYDPRFGSRGHGEGPYAMTIRALFRAAARRYGLQTHE